MARHETQHPPKVAVITGASSGLGAELARELSRHGWSVGLIARREDRLMTLADEIRQAGGRTAIAVADVSDKAMLLAAFDSIRGELGAVDLLIANAGVGKPDFLDPFTVDDIEQMIRVNLLGVLYSIAAVLPQMIEQRRGHIAAVSSAGAYKGMPGSAGYCASKSAVSTLLEGLRIQLREYGVSVTTICPGFVRTDMTDVNSFRMPWLQEPDAAARKIVRALNRRKKVYNFPWQMALMIKLLRWLPDWFIARTLPRKSDVVRNNE
ncbi:MAG: SDR family NAD(P)-dependent oxidoreductase [Planctomycetaceae bacterium]|jgi:short-subunit dehydrogenase|nr:SDR family NAD(P)-dependent oxidoreductase [Planctomycetaceae bacterium]MBT6157271.1 SDR family NAD(P)-dependent oxidoreductase [Planctomycetaceae bacterium]MBT6486793.1 SDR family NAD(P)-dependent oxidoreductase [Planctomycetaceae bacterium]MBT6493362.1 SDR family NAD(P)-dependent oxidoreductase [Planctomycetaceae bacterium]